MHTAHDPSAIRKLPKACLYSSNLSVYPHNQKLQACNCSAIFFVFSQLPDAMGIPVSLHVVNKIC